MNFNYLNYELAKEKGYIDNVESYNVLIKAAFTSLDNMKYDINHNCKLCNNKGDAFVFVDDNRCGHLYVYDGFNTIFEMSVLRSANRL